MRVEAVTTSEGHKYDEGGCVIFPFGEVEGIGLVYMRQKFCRGVRPKVDDDEFWRCENPPAE